MTQHAETATQEAEQHSISTSLDPVIERDELEPLVAQWNDQRLGSRVREKAKTTLRQRSSGNYASDLILLKERSSICASADRARIVVRPSSPPSLWRSTGSSTCAWNSSKTLRMTVSPSHRRRRLIVVRLLQRLAIPCSKLQ